jgi:hypothetical protein
MLAAWKIVMLELIVFTLIKSVELIIAQSNQRRVPFVFHSVLLASQHVLQVVQQIHYVMHAQVLRSASV